MITLPKALMDKYDKQLVKARIDPQSHNEYDKWLRYYLDFCKKKSRLHLESIIQDLFVSRPASKAQSALQLN